MDINNQLWTIVICYLQGKKIRKQVLNANNKLYKYQGNDRKKSINIYIYIYM